MASAVTALIFVLFSLSGWGTPGLPAALAWLALAALLLAVGTWAAGASEPHFGRKDDGRIVIDEVVGQLLALVPVALFAVAPGGVEESLLVVTGFVLFRVFDVWKPGPVGWVERRFEGGFGVMADDLVAGLLAAPLVAALGLALGALGGPGAQGPPA